MIFPLSFLLGPVARWLLRRKPSLTQGHAERQASALLWAALVVLAVVGVWAFFHFHDKGVIERHEIKQIERSIPAINRAAEDRANDALQNGLAAEERERAIAGAEAAEKTRPASERATLPPTTVALNCQRLKAAGLTKSAAYRDLCQ